MVAYDPGPPPNIAAIFDNAPDYTPDKDHFWFDWGPIFYRGRLDGTARILCIGQDPGPNERIACRILVGDAGQRVQGFLAKLGLTHSYVCFNTFLYGMPKSQAHFADLILSKPEHIAWRNQLFDAIHTANLQAIVAFGVDARKAIADWPGKGDLPLFNVPHPSSRDMQTLLDKWRQAITALRGIVTADPDGNTSLPNYGQTFTEADYAPIPAGDLPFGMPTWIGDGAAGRQAQPPSPDWVHRPGSGVHVPTKDDRHTLVWFAPGS